MYLYPFRRKYPLTRQAPRVSSLAAVLLLTYASVGQSSSSMFLEIKNIEGSATEPNYQNTIEVLSFSQGSSSAAGQGNPLLNLQPLAITKRTDKASIGLADALLEGGQSLDDWKLSFVQNGPTPKLLMTLELCDVFVSNYNAGGAGGADEPPNEFIEFTYGGYRLGTPELDLNGIPTGGLEYAGTDGTIGSCFVAGVPPSIDSDGDGLSNAKESALGTNPFLVDTDGDGLVDGLGGFVATSAYPAGVDANGDQFVDGEGDLGTNPTMADTDEDTFSDGIEVAAGSDPLEASSTPPGSVIPGDLNGDGLIDVADILLGSELLRGAIALTPQYLQRGDVAPLVGGVSSPDGVFDLGDLLIIQSRVLNP